MSYCIAVGLMFTRLRSYATSPLAVQPIGTLTSTSILIIDSFYISAFLSGGITYLVLTVTFFFIMPFLKCHRNDALIAPSVAVMSIACTSGNFLENGFPANIIFLAIIMQKSKIGAKVVG